MNLKRGLFLATLLTLSIQLNASAQTASVETLPPAAAQPASVTAPPASTAEVTPAPIPPAAPAAPAAETVNAPAPATAEVTPVAPPVEPPIAPGPTPVPTAPAETASAQLQPPAAPQQVISAKDFILKQEELGYGVSLVSKAAKIRIPFESNPILIEGKDQIKTTAGRLFSEVKELPDNLTSMAINLMTYKKDDKDHDFGLIALELKESARADMEVFKGLIKTSMLSYFKEETFFIADKFPLIVIIAHNYPEGKKEDIKWAFDLAQKKFEK